MTGKNKRAKHGASSSAKLGSSSSASGSASPNPFKRITRAGFQADKNAKLSPVLKNSEPKKGRKRVRTVTVKYNARAPKRLFGGKADEIRQGLERRVADVEIVINSNDGRAGCFVVEEDGGEVFVEMLHMVSPFQRLINLNVTDLVKAIAEHMLEDKAFRFAVPQ